MENDSMQPLGELLPAARNDLAAAQSAPSPTTGSRATRTHQGEKLLIIHSSQSKCLSCSGNGVFCCLEEIAQANRLIIIERYYGDRVLAICTCAAGAERARRWSGLTEEASQVSLNRLRSIPDQQDALRAIVDFIAAPRGWVTLVGPYGVGKTTFLYGALNALAARGIHGTYTTAPDLIALLRSHYEQGASAPDELRRLAEVPVLAVDELCKYRSTPYAEEAIFRLFDARYRARNRLATLIAYNEEHRIQGYLLSRIWDGRFKRFELGSTDLRYELAADEHDPWEGPWTA